MSDDRASSSTAFDDEGNFAANVKRLREDRGWSQGEMAQRLEEHGLAGFHQTTISRIEKRERSIRLGEARTYSAAFNVPIEQLLTPPSYFDSLSHLNLAMQAHIDAGHMMEDGAAHFLTTSLLLQLAIDEAEEADVPEAASRLTANLAHAKERLGVTLHSVMAPFFEDEHETALRNVWLRQVEPGEPAAVPDTVRELFRASEDYVSEAKIRRYRQAEQTRGDD